MKLIAAFILRLLLSLRYSVRITGAGKIRALRGALVLPNHPAEIDPVILSAWLWPKLKFRPVALEDYYYAPFIGKAIQALGAISVPDMDYGGGRYKRMRVEKGTAEAENALKSGESLLFYPSGRLMGSGAEMLKGSSGVHRLMHAAEDFPVVLVRTRGLWGSGFSKAFTLESPNFLSVLSRGAVIVLRNLVFFTPRRRVSIDITVLRSKELSGLDIASLNRYLENHYNENGEEPLSLVPFYFWSRKKPLPFDKGRSFPAHTPDPETESKLRLRLSQLSGRDASAIRRDMRLGYDLGIDSLALAELVIWMKDEFDIADVELPDLNTVDDLLRAVTGDLPRVAGEENAPAPDAWNEAQRPDVAFEQSGSIPEAFLRISGRMKDAVACADERTGVLTYRRYRLASLVLSRELRKVPGQNVAVMLPASVGASLSFMALHLAGKTPVLLNWTAGRRNVEHALASSKAERIITSRAFLDMLEDDFDFCLDRFLFIEDVKANVGFVSKISGLRLSRMSTQRLMKKLYAHAPTRNDTAAILFTSGSEAMPKGVPLSHENILSNIGGAFEALDVNPSYVLYSFLPPFHSFGLTATTLLPLLTGIKHVFFPNPNASRKIAAGCRRWGITILAGTPSFIRNIFIAGMRDMFSTLELVVSGAERAPESLFTLVAGKSGAELCEGYGITECAPVVCVNFPKHPHSGVGQPLRDVTIAIANEDLTRECSDGERGLILIQGPNVFSGYLTAANDPFVTFKGERWYSSGDLGYMKGGLLHISGRLKRFVKVGGEMISLPALEDALKEKFPDTKKGPVIALVEAAADDRSEIVLASAVDTSVDEVNGIIFAAGFPAVARVRRVVRMEKIPLLGSGKADIQEITRLVKG